MSRKKSDQNDDAARDGLFDKLFESARKEYGDDRVYTGAEAEQLVIGVPLPALSLRYLFQSTVMSFGRIMGLFGSQGSGKSAFLYEVFRWFRQLDGFCVLLETENKDSGELRNSIADYDTDKVIVRPCENMNTWMETWNFFLDRFQRLCDGTKEKPGSGRNIPLCLGVDSLMGTLTQESVEKYDKEAPGRSHPVEAMSLARHFTHATPKLYGWPVSYVFTNHYKPTKDHHGGDQFHAPGGTAPHFFSTYEFHLSRMKDINASTYKGIRINFVAKKNSLGPRPFSMIADLLWRYDQTEDGQAIQYTHWEWDAASIQLLLTLQTGQKDRKIANRISEIVDLHTKNAGSKGTVVWSQALGIPSDSGVPFSEAGKILEANQEIVHALHLALGVREHAAYRPGEDYRQRVHAARQVSDELASRRAVFQQLSKQFHQSPNKWDDGDHEELGGEDDSA